MHYERQRPCSSRPLLNLNAFALGVRSPCDALRVMNSSIDELRISRQIDVLLFKREKKTLLTVRAMMMTACDLNGTTKPWEVQKEVSLLLFLLHLLHYLHLAFNQIVKLNYYFLRLSIW